MSMLIETLSITVGMLIFALIFLGRYTYNIYQDRKQYEWELRCSTEHINNLRERYHEFLDARNQAQEELCYARTRIRELECYLIND